MTPRGAAPLIAMRKAGQRPAAAIWLEVDVDREPDWWKWSNTQYEPKLAVFANDSVALLDFRCALDLEVILFCPVWSDQTERVYEQLQNYAKEIAVASPSFEEDIGWWWIKGFGRVEFHERHHLDALKDAQADCVSAARSDNQTAYAAARSRELAILEAAPWLR